MNDRIVRGRYEGARVLAVDLARKYPADPLVVGLVIRLDAETKRTSMAEAEEALRTLAAHHPEEVRLLATAAYLAVRQGRRDDGLRELRDLAAQSDDPRVHVVLGDVLRFDRALWNESWTHFGVALRAGSLPSPCYRSVAYFVGREVDRQHAIDALQGASTSERLAVRVRSRGPALMFLLLELLVFGAAALRISGPLPLSLVVFALAVVWAGYAMYANQIVCCRKCRNAWLKMSAVLAMVYVLTPFVFSLWLLAVGTVGAVVGTLVASKSARATRAT